MRRVSNHIVASCLTFLSSSSSPLAELFVIFHPLFQRNPFYACRWYTQGPQGGVHTIGYCFGEKQCIRLNSYIFHLIKGFHQFLAKTANFCPNLAVFGPKILIFCESNSKFWYPYYGTLFVLFFGRVYGTKWNKNADIWPKMPNLAKAANLVLAGSTEKRSFFRFCRKAFFWPKIWFFPKNTLNLQKDWYFIGKRVLFFAQLFPVLART